MDIMTYIGPLQYLWMLIFIMIFAGLAKEHNLFAPAFAHIRNVFRSNKFVLAFISAVGGVLPIEGRVTVSAGLLDQIAPKNQTSRQKYGIVDFLATHHYYMWSPLEKTVILPIAALGLTYAGFIGMVAPLIAVSLVFITWYIWYKIKDEEISIAPTNFKTNSVIRNILPFVATIVVYIYFGGAGNVLEIFGAMALYYMFLTQTWDWKKLNSYINWQVILTVGAVIILGTFFKTYSLEFTEYIRNIGFDPHSFLGMSAISATGFLFSFLMGSSSKYAALSVLMAQLFGTEYFLWFFAVDYAGYLISPMHKCTMVGNRYFGTPFTTYYKALGVWITLLLTVSGIATFVLPF